MELTYALLAVAIAIALYRWVTRNHDYFHRKPIPSMAVQPIVGSTAPLVFKQRSFPDFIQGIYDQFAGVRVFGLFDFNRPMYVLRDPELIKRITIKDFEHFTDHRPIFGVSHQDNPNLVFQKILFVLTGQQWKNMRATLSPAFTGSKMRQMFDLIVECSESMVKFYQGEVRSSGGKEYEMKDVFGRFTTDVIATCAFGLKVDSSRQRDNEFFLHGKKMMKFTRPSVVARMIGYQLVPSLMERLEIDMVDKEQNVYFSSLIKETVRAREAQGILRPDMVNLLMQARKGMLKHQQENEQEEGFATVQESDLGKAQSTSTMTELEMIAQCLIFFLAGFDTVSTCLTFMAYELAINSDVQAKLYEEIMETNKALQGKSLTYDALQRMKYMDMVVTETLRMWPPLAALDRLCVRDYQLDVDDGLKVTIEKGAGVWLPVYALHHDPKYYPEPQKFIPERFSDENKGNINLGAYLPFGIGPRNCIGSRFALMEVKAIMYYLLANFSFERTQQTEVPLKIEKGFTSLTAENGVFVELRPRKSS